MAIGDRKIVRKVRGPKRVINEKKPKFKATKYLLAARAPNGRIQIWEFSTPASAKKAGEQLKAFGVEILVGWAE